MDVANKIVVVVKFDIPDDCLPKVKVIAVRGFIGRHFIVIIVTRVNQLGSGNSTSVVFGTDTISVYSLDPCLFFDPGTGATAEVEDSDGLAGVEEAGQGYVVGCGWIKEGNALL